ncbi:MAG: hypothetical protein IT292_05280 [Deltaproteobacteria bacterium]|nr:hypothetical protein [Deltaproteobacteria bacterium]
MLINTRLGSKTVKLLFCLLLSAVVILPEAMALDKFDEDVAVKVSNPIKAGPPELAKDKLKGPGYAIVNADLAGFDIKAEVIIIGPKNKNGRFDLNIYKANAERVYNYQSAAKQPLNLYKNKLTKVEITPYIKAGDSYVVEIMPRDKNFIYKAELNGTATNQVEPGLDYQIDSAFTNAKLGVNHVPRCGTGNEICGYIFAQQENCAKEMRYAYIANPSARKTRSGTIIFYGQSGGDILERKTFTLKPKEHQRLNAGRINHKVVQHIKAKDKKGKALITQFDRQLLGCK